MNWKLIERLVKTGSNLYQTFHVAQQVTISLRETFLSKSGKLQIIFTLF